MIATQTVFMSTEKKTSLIWKSRGRSYCAPGIPDASCFASYNV